MSETIATRTLVKSPPELWTELSDVDSLARRLDAFGEIRITRLEDEHTVAWEGERASGTVELTPSGWGTRVTLTAVPSAATEEPAAVAAPAPDPVAAGEHAPREADDDDPGRAAERPAASTPGKPVDVRPSGEGGEPARPGWLSRLLGRFRRAEAPAVEPGPTAERPAASTPRMPVDVRPGPRVGPTAERPAASTPRMPVDVRPGPEPVLIDVDAVLEGVLDDLGAAHHRPFSR